MHYWNQENFEGLKNIAERFKNEAGFELFAEYCSLKEKGLKKQAVSIVKDYVKNLENLELKKQRDICVRLAELAFWNSDIHQLLSHPLQVYITDIFTKWCSIESSAAPYTLLGYMTGENECFIQALKHNPTDQIALYRLAISAIDDVDFQVHHVSESIFLGEEKNAINRLEEAKTYFNRMEDSKYKEYLTKEITDSEELLKDWMSYKEQVGQADIASISFPKWCEVNGKSYSFSQPIYYDE
ncbi:hypothetical protein [Thalassotalea sp. G2M2-11]|uniref:hypothetical protein n=1 Tax=Thalassotalea sp. G2M2-11 TaxID=2787627 RepID=UPI0019D1513F|nr:hypothetical protein [Thalassotalea sp. G2M2-11]